MLEPLYMFVMLRAGAGRHETCQAADSEDLVQNFCIFSLSLFLFSFSRQPVIAFYSQAHLSAGFPRPAPNLVHVFPERMSGIE